MEIVTERAYVPPVEPPAEPIQKVTLILSLEEAAALCAVLMRVGGDAAPRYLLTAKVWDLNRQLLKNPSDRKRYEQIAAMQVGAISFNGK